MPVPERPQTLILFPACPHTKKSTPDLKQVSPNRLLDEQIPLLHCILLSLAM